MEEANIKIDFSYTDEFGQQTRLAKTYTDAVLMDQEHIGFLLEEFKMFLQSMGYSYKVVNQIKFVDED